MKIHLTLFTHSQTLHILLIISVVLEKKEVNNIKSTQDSSSISILNTGFYTFKFVFFSLAHTFQSLWIQLKCAIESGLSSTNDTSALSAKGNIILILDQYYSEEHPTRKERCELVPQVNEYFLTIQIGAKVCCQLIIQIRFFYKSNEILLHSSNNCLLMWFNVETRQCTTLDGKELDEHFIVRNENFNSINWNFWIQFNGSLITEDKCHRKNKSICE